jgi:hypothetical protein
MARFLTQGWPRCQVLQSVTAHSWTAEESQASMGCARSRFSPSWRFITAIAGVRRSIPASPGLRPTLSGEVIEPTLAAWPMSTLAYKPLAVPPTRFAAAAVPRSRDADDM